MRRGTRHTLSGTLGWDGRNCIYVLHVEGGGYSFVDMPWRSSRLIGKEIVVEGVRSGFNLFDVSRVLESRDPSPRS